MKPKLDFEQRQEVNGLLQIAVDEDNLEAALSNIIWERDAARERMGDLESAIQNAIDTIPSSMGGHVTLGLNILQASLRQRGDAPKEEKPCE